MTDFTKHPFGKMFSYLETQGFAGEGVRFTSVDTETEIGLIRDKKSPIDRMGKTSDEFMQHLAGVRQFGYESAVYNKIATPRGSGGMKSVSEYHIINAKNPVSAILGLRGPGGKPLFEPSEVKGFLQNALHAQFIGAGNPWDPRAAAAGRRETLAKLPKMGQARFTKMAEAMFGKAGSVMVGHNINHELMVMRAYMPEVAPLTFDTLTAAREVFPELGLGRAGAFKLENIRALMEYVGTGSVVSQAVANTDIETDLARMKLVDPQKFYGEEVVAKVGPALKAGYEYAQRVYGGFGGKAHATAAEGVVSSMALMHAIFTRAGEKTPSGTQAADRIKTYMERQGILPHQTLQQIVSYKNRYDPRDVQQFMDHTSGMRKGSVMNRLRTEHSVIMDDLGLKAYSRGGFDDLYSLIDGQFGKNMASQVRRTVNMLSANMSAPVMFLRKTRHGYTDLAFGQRGMPGSFISMPLQVQNALGRGVAFEGTQAKAATPLMLDMPAGRKVYDYATTFYKSLRGAARGRYISDANVQYSLYNLVKQARATSVGVNARGGLSLSDPGTGGLTVGKLLGSPVYAEGQAVSAAARRAGLTAFALSGEIASAKSALDLAIAKTKQSDILFGKGGVEATTAAFANLHASMAHMADVIGRSGLGKEFSILTKADNLAEPGPLRMPVPEARGMLGPATILQESSVAKGHRAVSTAARDMTAEQASMLRRMGVFVGDYASPLTDKLAAHTAEAISAFVYFHGKKAGMRTEALFGDSGILATARGMSMHAERQYAGTTRLQNVPSHILADLETVFGGALPDLSKRLPNIHSMPAVYGDALSSAQKEALGRVIAATGRGQGRRYLEMFAEGKVGLNRFSIQENELKMGFQHRKVKIPAFANFLIGAGSQRVEAVRTVKGKLSRALRHIDYIRPYGNIHDSAARSEDILRHRLAYGRDLGLAGEMSSFLSAHTGASVRLGATGVTAPGVSPEKLFGAVAAYGKHLRGLSHRTREQISMLRGFSGIPLTGAERRAIAAEAGVARGEVGGFKLIQPMHFRVTSTDLSRSIAAGVKYTTQHMGIMRQAQYHAEPLIPTLLNERLFKQTGFKFVDNSLVASNPLKAFISGFSARGSEYDVLLEPYKGSYRVTGHAPAHLRGQVLSAPATSYKPGTRAATALGGTIYDPELLGKYTMAVKLEGPFNFRMGKGGATHAIHHLPVAPPGVSGLGGEFIDYSRDSVLGAYSRLFQAYAQSPDDMSRRFGTYGVPGTKGPIPLSALMHGTLEVLFRGTAGKKGFVGSAAARISQGGTYARPVHLGSEILGEANQLDRLIAGKSLQADKALDVYMSESSLQQWMDTQFGPGDRRARGIMRKLSSEGARNYLYAYVLTDPMHAAERGQLVRLRMAKRVKAAAAKGELGLYMDPGLLARLTRDLDLDRVSLSLVDFMGVKGGMSRGAIRKAADREFALSATRAAAWYPAWASKLSADAFDAAHLAALDATASPSAKGLLGRISGKAGPPLPYSQLRSTRMLLGSIQGSRTVEEVATRLMSHGYETPAAIRAAERLFPLLESGAVVHAQQSIGAFYQSFIKKGGAHRAAYEKAVVGLAHAFSQAGRQSPEAIEGMVRSAISDIPFTPGDADWFLKGAHPAGLVGEVFGSAIWASRQKGASFSSLSKLAETDMTQADLRSIMGAILGGDKFDEMFDEASATYSSDEYVRERAADFASDTSTTRRTIGEQAEAIKDSIWDGLKTRTSEAADYVKGPGKHIALFGGLAAGAFAVIKGLSGGEHAAPPPTAPRGGPPLPPPPILRSPEDRGPMSLPSTAVPPPAKISPTHPAPIPRHHMSRTYSKIPSARSSAADAKPGRVDIRDHTDPMSKHLIRRRMDDVSDSDFVR